MKKKSFKLGLVPKLIIAIILGILWKVFLDMLQHLALSPLLQQSRLTFSVQKQNNKNYAGMLICRFL